ncbi:MAG: LuxR C-terminal-related transcriptional regulator [Aristaeellaceae bacterium]
MPKPKWSLNAIYISERLKESLRPISRCALTAVVAPMGYGKTTAVNWFLEQRARAEAIRVVRISVYSDHLEILWKSIQNAFARAGLDFLRDYPCPTDAAGGGLLADDLCHELAGETPFYLFIDDFHLLKDQCVAGFLCALANRLPGNVHLIVASRERFLPAGEVVRLGSRVYQIGTEHLRLTRTELALYAHRCGIRLSDAQVDALLYASEGWFSAAYLNLRTLSERGSLPDASSDIYTTFTAAMIDPLPEKQQELLAVMGLADELTVDLVRFVTGDAHAEGLLSVWTEQNAFVQRLQDGVTFRFHHMMKECAERRFRMLDREKQLCYLERFGLWYENSGQYLHAMAFCRRCGNYDALLRVIRKDAGILLSSLDPQVVLADVEACPADVLKAHPLSLLVLMRCMFNWRMIPQMLEMKALLMAAIGEHPEMPAREKGDLLGESDLIMSFLCYNDISAMSRLHRSASEQMSRPAISIRRSGGWTFGSPSVLMMFYRAPGEMQSELAEMDECMPHYYRVTNNHGQGAEKIMRAEAAYAQGRFTDAAIELEQAYAQIEGNGQVNMALCCDFLAWRLSLYADVAQRYSFEERRAELLRHHNAAWINIWSAASAYCHALAGETERIPDVFAGHQLSTIHFLAPGRPMMDMIENQVYLAQGAWARVIGRHEGQLAVCDAMHYALVALHIRIQTAAAYAQLGKTGEALAWLGKALSDAEPDSLVMPFVENYDHLQPMLTRVERSGLVGKIIGLGEAARARKVAATRPAALAALTQREYEIVRLMAQRLTNREIAERLYLSEGSVKQYVNRIYSKLQITGEIRTKRKQLLTMLRAAEGLTFG